MAFVLDALGRLQIRWLISDLSHNFCDFYGVIIFTRNYTLTDILLKEYSPRWYWLQL